MRRLAPVACILTTLIATLLLAAACGQTNDSDGGTPSQRSDAASQSATDSPSPSASPTPTIPVVSEETTCSLLLGNDANGPLNQAIKIVRQKSYTSDDLSNVQDAAGSFDYASASAQPDLRPYIDAIADVMHTVEQQIQDGQGGNIDLQNFRAAGLELTNRCIKYLS